MRVAVYNKKLKAPDITFSLVAQGDRVALVVVDPETGLTRPGGILLILSENAMFLNNNVSKDFGLALDRTGGLRRVDSETEL